MRNDVFDIIISLVNSLKEPTEFKQHYIKSSFENKNYCIYNAEYLLNQILRQISIPDDHYLISKGAKDLWDKLSPNGKNGNKISDYWYREVLTVNSKTSVNVKEFKGASKSATNVPLTKGSTFIFNDVFHLEHVIPIQMIIDELTRLSKAGELNYQSLAHVLNMIYVCRMTKEEDRKIEPRYKSQRFLDLEKVKSEVYAPVGIEVLQ